MSRLNGQEILVSEKVILSEQAIATSKPVPQFLKDDQGGSFEIL